MPNLETAQAALRQRRHSIALKAVRDLTRFDIPRAIGVHHLSIDGAPPADIDIQEGPFKLNFSRHDPLLTTIRRLLVFSDTTGDEQTVNLAFGCAVLNRREHTATIVQPLKNGEVLTYTLSRLGVEVGKLTENSPQELKDASQRANRNLAADLARSNLAALEGFEFKRP